MKRLGSPDSLACLIPLCPKTEEHSPRSNHVYTRDIQSMLEGLDDESYCIEESSHVPEKKRRLSVDQVKSLEKYFEVENKLEPERKVKLSQELGLQPRQVAVWFQNRRARWKTKQLERDYGVLKSSYDTLIHDYDTLKHDHEALLKEVKDMKTKLQDSKVIKNPKSSPPLSPIALPETREFNYDSFKNQNNNGVSKDGSSDSDSSAILQEDNSPNAAAISSYCGVLQSNPSVVMSPTSSSLNFNHCSASPSSSSMNGGFQFQPQQYVKLEEQSLYNTDEACDLFSDEQAPSLQWYCPDQWN